MHEFKQLTDIRKEPLITKNWKFKKPTPSSFPDGILVTAANSFVGAHVACLLQKKWPGPIHLLLRAGTKQEAAEKMSKAWSNWGLGEFDGKNYTIHLGDVCLPAMGLKPADFKLLKTHVGFVLHLAMNPLKQLPYAHFQRLWLPELSRMIAFCGDKSNPKSLHYPSSYMANLFTEEEDFRQLNSNIWQSGYTGFKWVAGQSLKNAFRQGIRGCIYDVPLVLGSLEKGISQQHCTIWQMLDMFLKTKCFIPFQIRVIPVDILAEIMVQNLMDDLKDKGTHFIRPLLEETVSDNHLRNMAASLLHLQETNQAAMREKCISKERFDFIFPPDFYKQLEKINKPEAVFPAEFNTPGLPSSMMVFLSNLNRILSHQNKISIH